ncbi:hypothetical protein LXL04_012660 [Taraxacum kok-saghyz]
MPSTSSPMKRKLDEVIDVDDTTQSSTTKTRRFDEGSQVGIKLLIPKLENSRSLLLHQDFFIFLLFSFFTATPFSSCAINQASIIGKEPFNGHKKLHAAFLGVEYPTPFHAALLGGGVPREVSALPGARSTSSTAWNTRTHQPKENRSVYS